ncbi:MAG: Deazaflavin-dependent nitroreductase [Acidimicrobiaceae bacterium]|nr:MAG: Deazaflavin-dependent nitroreductase [Acidimicrobiaceae bacterium]|tara:strand:- start:293 stop:763 length:471 start_codon:yes stop_codon:yes gene_type:complete
MENENQRIEQFWDTPTHDQIVEISHAHVEALEASNEDNVWQQVGMHHIILTTIGRRSGKEHKCALPIWRDEDGHRVVVGSFAGADKEPDWLANLRDKASNSEVKIRTQNSEYVSTPEILEGLERDLLWNQLCEDRAWYNDYQERTERVIPLIRFSE